VGIVDADALFASEKLSPAAPSAFTAAALVVRFCFEACLSRDIGRILRKVLVKSLDQRALRKGLSVTRERCYPTDRSLSLNIPSNRRNHEMLKGDAEVGHRGTKYGYYQSLTFDVSEAAHAAGLNQSQVAMLLPRLKAFLSPMLH
jgi:hypothetical protein